ncbi:hypothetical protein KY343_06255 [Candidatus Woesearchaeota archaeon]|nr:hypothetical protein [Candidatus Woesearchaeota archaeon]
MKNAQISDAKCIICREGITNPICPECLAKEIKYWRPELETSLAMPETSTGSVRCVFCGKGMNICAHCYSRDIYDLIKEEFPWLAEEFIERFDFGLREELA